MKERKKSLPHHCHKNKDTPQVCFSRFQDVDDAQSCSYDDEFENPSEKLKGCLNAASSADDDQDGVKKKGDFCGNSCCDEDFGMMQEHYKSCVSDDSCLEPADEVEKSRQFWEACLAS
ncbi:uncharacterized protein LOC110263131 isoform X2 [Arachis ipaensis]|uniref:uncharacterized protein LOC110263131 isoform X2 n=1 Tax=Arachis ipaensis TaxID=130454 RepID=UPI000A2B03C5|nr:uncharacterized protein LOC110263131 isoform X2 [Arachis ipaensis]XP_025663392.1 uncharacterized protein LOC112758834 [Arachis hypogaea]